MPEDTSYELSDDGSSRERPSRVPRVDADGTIHPSDPIGIEQPAQQPRQSGDFEGFYAINRGLDPKDSTKIRVTVLTPFDTDRVQEPYTFTMPRNRATQVFAQVRATDHTWRNDSRLEQHIATNPGLFPKYLLRVDDPIGFAQLEATLHGYAVPFGGDDE